MTFLLKFQLNLLSTLYAKCESKNSFTDKHASMLCPGGNGPKNCRIILRAGNPRESGPKSKAEFLQYSASFSRYNESQGKSLSTKILDIYEGKGRPQFVAMATSSGEETSNERSELENEIAQVQGKRKDLEKIIEANSNRTKGMQIEINKILSRMRTLKEGLKAPISEQAKLKKIDGQIQIIKQELSKDTVKAKNKLINDYKKFSVEIIDYTEVILLRSQDCIKLHDEILLENEAN
eukprot:GSChrysophyteH2.ASY1.ANO1.1305.1 assembled CDS